MYAVFGVCRARAELTAKKNVPAVVDGKSLTLEEYTERLISATDYEFERMKPGKLSCIYANKREAQHFLNLAQAAGMKQLVLKRAVSTQGVAHKTTGKNLLEWMLA